MVPTGPRSLATLWCALLLTLSGSPRAEGIKVRIATEGAFAPWNATDPAGTLIGFEPDLARDLCRRMRAQCDLVAQDWDGMIPALIAGRYDAIMAGMVITEERRKAIAFAGPYANEPSVFAARRDAPLAALTLGRARVELGRLQPDDERLLSRLGEAMAGKTVGVQVSTIQAVVLETHFPQVTLRLYERLDAAALDLEAGRIDALFANRSALNALTSGDLTLFGPSIAGGPLGVGVGVGVRHADVALKDRFDEAIAAATADGTVSALSLRWFGHDVSVTARP
ncbi:MAG TPA: transporter substrate-binding domain-containing protein [Azospirillum sp.]|nr:transporter substrate-binding domain-containing protein [Azospirillum sp.]